MPDLTPPSPPPGFLSRIDASPVGVVEEKALDAMRFSAHGGGGTGVGGAWWGDTSSGAYLIGTLPGGERDVVAEVGDAWMNGAVGAGLGWITDNFSEPDAQVVKFDARTRTRTPIFDHDCINRLEIPNEDYDADALFAATVLSFIVAGNAYWVKVKDKSGKVLRLFFVPHWEISPVWPDDGSEFISGYSHVVDGRAFPLEKGDVIHFRRGMDPSNLRIGLPQLAPVFREIATDNAASVYEAAILRNMGVPGVVIQPAEPGDQFADGEPEILKGKFRVFTGENRGDALVTNARVDIKKLSLSPNELSLDKIRNVPEDRICAALRVPGMVIGLTSGAMHKSYANYAEARKAAYDDCLVPLQKKFAKTLTRQLLIPDFGGVPGVHYVEWDYSNVSAMSEDANARAERAVALFDGKIIKRGEACEIAGVRAPDPKFDVYLESEAVAQAVANADARDDGLINESVTGRKPGDAAGGDDAGDDVDDEVPAGRLRIAKALALADAGKAATNGHASPEREDDADPFPLLAGRKAGPRPVGPEEDPDDFTIDLPQGFWAEDGPTGEDDEEAGPDEANTYNLPSGKPIESKLREFFDRQMKDILGTVRTIGADLGDPTTWAALPAVPLGLGDHDRPMAQAMTPLIGAYWDESGKRTMARLGLDPDDWRVVDPNTRRKIEDAAFAFSRSTNETTTKDLRQALDELRRELAEGIVDRGESLPQLTKRVRGVFDTASKSRAKAIAETEASRAVHQAQLESARQSGVVWGKRLLLSSDACALCHEIAASQPEGGWPLDAEIHDDGRGHPDYSSVSVPPLHIRCRCTYLDVIWEDAPAGVVRPVAGPIFPEGVVADEPEPEPVAEPKPEPKPKPVRKPRAPRTPKPEPEPKPAADVAAMEAELAGLIAERSRLNREMAAAMARQSAVVQPYVSAGKPMPAEARAAAGAIQAEIDAFAAAREALKGRQKQLDTLVEDARIGWVRPATMEEAVARAAAKGVHVHPGSTRPVTLDDLADVLREVTKIPGHVLDVIMGAGRRMELVAGMGITDHPDFAQYRGVTPRGHVEGTTWDVLPGAGGIKTVIVANRIKEGQFGANLVLHEHAHTYDVSAGMLRKSAEWLAVHGAASWTSAYQRDYPEEGFAESFAHYFDGPSSRAILDPLVRRYWDAKVAEWTASASASAPRARPRASS